MKAPGSQTLDWMDRNTAGCQIRHSCCCMIYLILVVASDVWALLDVKLEALALQIFQQMKRLGFWWLGVREVMIRLLRCIQKDLQAVHLIWSHLQGHYSTSTSSWLGIRIRRIIIPYLPFKMICLAIPGIHSIEVMDIVAKIEYEFHEVVWFVGWIVVVYTMHYNTIPYTRVLIFMETSVWRLSKKLTLYKLICKFLQISHIKNFAYIGFLLKPYFGTIVSSVAPWTTLHTSIS